MPQHMQALEMANRIRFAQANALRQVRAGQSIREVLFSDAPEYQSIAIGRLLRAQNRWGYTRTNKLLRRLVINENRPLRKLTSRQKDAIACEVEGA